MRFGFLTSTRHSTCRYGSSALVGALLAVVAGHVPPALAPRAQAQPVSVTVAHSRDNPPMNWVDDDGVSRGILVDIWRAMGERAGIDVRFRGGEWLETHGWLKDGSVDALAGLAVTKKREAWLQRAGELWPYSVAVFWHRGLPARAPATTLEGLRVGVVARSNTARVFAEKYPDAGVREYPTSLAMVDALARGEVLAIVNVDVAARYALAQRGLGGRFVRPDLPPLYSRRYEAAVARGRDELAERLVAGFALLPESERVAIARGYLSLSEGEADALQVGVFDGYPPYSSVDADGVPVGYLPDLLALWSERSGRALNLRVVPFEGSIARLERGELDILAALTPTRERAEHLAFTEPLIETESTVFRSAHAPVEVPRRLGALAGTAAETYALTAWPTATVQRFDSIAEAVRSVADGSIDGLVAQRVWMLAWLARSGSSGALVAGDERFLVEPLAAAVAPSRAALLAELNTGLTAISVSERAEIEARWVPNPDARTYRAERSDLILSSAERAMLREHPRIHYRLGAERPPLALTASDGTPSGLVVDLLDELGRRLGVDFVAVDESDRPAAIRVGVSRSPDTGEGFEYTEPLHAGQAAVYTLGASGDLAAFVGRRVAVVRGTGIGELVRGVLSGVRLLAVDTPEAGLDALTAGDADAFVGLRFSAQGLTRGGRFEDVNEFVGVPFDARPRIAVDSAQGDLRRLLDRALASMAPGERAAIEQRWAAAEVRSGIDRKVVAQLVMVAFVVLLAAMAWIAWLRRQQARLRAAEREAVENERRMAQAREEAEAGARAKSAFLATMSHEIRTPMNGVLGSVDLLADTRLDAPQSELVATMRESANALLRIIDDILDYSKLEAGKLGVDPDEAVTEHVVEGALAALSMAATNKGVRLRCLIDADVPERLLLDDGRVRQILLNLAGNAVKFTEAGSVDVFVHWSPGNGCQGTLRIEIRDTGIGLDEDQRARLFQPFSQAEQSTTRRFGGTGLGLAISRRLCDLMGGDIGVDSELGKGSTFWFEVETQALSGPPAPLEDAPRTLLVAPPGSLGGVRAYLESFGCVVRPVEAMADVLPSLEDTELVVITAAALGEEASLATQVADIGAHVPCVVLHDRRTRPPEAPGVVPLSGLPVARSKLRALVAARGAPESETTLVDSSTAEDGSGPLATLKVLVAEDNTINQRIIARQLETLGVAFDMYDEGASALGAWQEQAYDLLLTDCHMPMMDGFELTRRIRAAEQAAGAAPRPIIAVTASAMPEELAACRDAGMDDHLTKPLSMELLAQKLAHWQEKVTGERGGAEATEHPVGDRLAREAASRTRALS